MALSNIQKQLISNIDHKVKIILANKGTEEDILISLTQKMPSIMEMIKAAGTKEIEMYFDEYDGFYYFVKIIENLAQKISEGTIKVPR
jgi:hypothetical protein